MSEAELLAHVRLAVGHIPSVRLFRQNTGEGWCGKLVSFKNGVAMLAGARHVQFGLHPGSGDLIGFQTRLITADLLGTHVAQFASLEVKAPRGVPSEAQLNWLEVIRKTGGIAEIVRSVEDAEKIFARP